MFLPLKSPRAWPALLLDTLVPPHLGASQTYSKAIQHCSGTRREQKSFVVTYMTEIYGISWVENGDNKDMAQCLRDCWFWSRASAMGAWRELTPPQSRQGWENERRGAELHFPASRRGGGRRAIPWRQRRGSVRRSPHGARRRGHWRGAGGAAMALSAAPLKVCIVGSGNWWVRPRPDLPCGCACPGLAVASRGVPSCPRPAAGGFRAVAALSSGVAAVRSAAPRRRRARVLVVKHGVAGSYRQGLVCGGPLGAFVPYGWASPALGLPRRQRYCPEVNGGRSGRIEHPVLACL